MLYFVCQQKRLDEVPAWPMCTRLAIIWFSALRVSQSSVSFGALDSSEPQKPRKWPWSRRWRLLTVTRKTELLMRIHLAAILTDTLPGWPDVCPGGLINKADQGHEQRLVWLDVGWEQSPEMTGCLRPGLSQWRGRLAPALLGRAGPPSGAPECRYSIAWLRYFVV